MDYVSVTEAIDLPGLRLVLTAGVPGPWGEAAKGIFHVKGIGYVPVRQTAGEESEELREWTGQTSAPAAMYENERPRTGWAEILLLAERLEARSALLPRDPQKRAETFGVCHEICGEQGFAWSRRLMLLDPIMRDKPIDSSNPLAWKYGYSPEAADRAAARVNEVTLVLATRLREQHTAGRRFLIGETMTAADIYWATFAAMLVPLPVEQCPMPDWLRPMYDVRTTPSEVTFDPILLDHRDFIYRDYLALPMDF